MSLFVQKNRLMFETGKLLVLLLVFLAPVSPLMLVKVSVSSDTSVSSDGLVQMQAPVAGKESVTAVKNQVPAFSSTAAWELVEEEEIVDLYVTHYEAAPDQSPEAHISSAGHSGSHFVKKASRLSCATGASSSGISVAFVDFGRAWSDTFSEVRKVSPVKATSTVLLSYYSIRQGYINPDFAVKISVIANVRGFSV